MFDLSDNRESLASSAVEVGRPLVDIWRFYAERVAPVDALALANGVRGGDVRPVLAFRNVRAGSERCQQLRLVSRAFPTGFILRSNGHRRPLELRAKYGFNWWNRSSHGSHYRDVTNWRNVLVGFGVPTMGHELWHQFEDVEPVIPALEVAYLAARERAEQPMFHKYCHRRYPDNDLGCEVGSTVIEWLLGGLRKSSGPDEHHLAFVLGLTRLLSR